MSLVYRRVLSCDQSSLILSSFLSIRQQKSWSSRQPSISMQYIFSLMIISWEQAVRVYLYSAAVVGLSDRLEEMRRLAKEEREVSVNEWSSFSLSQAMLSLRGLLTFQLTKLTILLMALLSSVLIRSICPSRLDEMASIFSQAPKILLVLRDTLFSIFLMVRSTSSILSSGVSPFAPVSRVLLIMACISSLMRSSLLWMSYEQSCCLTSISRVRMFPARQSSNSLLSFPRLSFNASRWRVDSPFPPFLYSSLLLSMEFSVILIRMLSCCPSFWAILATRSPNSRSALSRLPSFSLLASRGLVCGAFCCGQQCCGLSWAIVASFLNSAALGTPCSCAPLPYQFFFLGWGELWATILLLLSFCTQILGLIMPASLSLLITIITIGHIMTMGYHSWLIIPLILRYLISFMACSLPLISFTNFVLPCSCRIFRARFRQCSAELVQFSLLMKFRPSILSVFPTWMELGPYTFSSDSSITQKLLIFPRAS